MRQSLIPAGDVRKDLPGVFSISAMIILCASFFNTACQFGNERISKPHFIIGTAENNNGCYPVAESVMAAIMAAVVVLNMAVNTVVAAVVNCRKAEEHTPLTGGFELKPVAGVHYYGLTNIACLHLPRLVLAASVLGLMASLPWVNVVMDWGVRMQHDDPNLGEALAGEYGRRLLVAIPVVQFFAACLLPAIKNLNYIRSENEASAPKAGLFARVLAVTDHLFVDHSKTYAKASASLQ